ncbi:MAG: TIGR01458 family HAD-type hydrolase [Leptospiraceae bacterium]|nr:TIGR01458 family HAD-type hydrolase [Leptospiraceae bacterium]
MPKPSDKALLLDLNGVLYTDEHLLPGAVEAVQLLQEHNIRHLYLTNNTTESRQTMANRLQSMGLAIEASAIMSPLEACQDWLRANQIESIHPVVSEQVRPEFQDWRLDHSQPQAIIIGDIGERWNYPIMNHLFAMAVYGAEILALHKGRYWQKDDALHLDIGAFVQGLEYAAGKKALVMGKPAPLFFQQALQRLGSSASQTVMFGDDIHDDIAGAQDAGLQGVLVQSGKYRPAALHASGIVPDGILESIADLPRWLGV